MLCLFVCVYSDEITYTMLTVLLVYRYVRHAMISCICMYIILFSCVYLFSLPLPLSLSLSLSVSVCARACVTGGGLTGAQGRRGGGEDGRDAAEGPAGVGESGV